jgi:hypothetical protein
MPIDSVSGCVPPTTTTTTTTTTSTTTTTTSSPAYLVRLYGKRLDTSVVSWIWYSINGGTYTRVAGGANSTTGGLVDTLSVSGTIDIMMGTSTNSGDAPTFRFSAQNATDTYNTTTLICALPFTFSPTSTFYDISVYTDNSTGC